ncbi:protein translocase subunit SecD [Allosaccharopolyspora coralli]|uniref:Protein translocase subunit SecD n=1 Tax=Allosaccharopolyspora coralli TaxID=2665642 RepID=A0A5Q3Q5L3_9PSEU|nr:protein translocase subunit SecD [Allosaccharopolyspora coralli]QGK69633.1 protein translocase subunit SecD [Allosaccharopolyspora coralli]
MASPDGHISPRRYLSIFALIVAALYSLVFFTGDGSLAPKLGIDLQGGTRVTLTARTTDGQPPSNEQLTQARNIIETRVNGMGVQGSEVTQDGSNLVITVPGEGGEEAKQLGQTAQLNFRKVVPNMTMPANPGAQPGQAPGPGQQQPPAPGQPAPSGQGPAGTAPQDARTQQDDSGDQSREDAQRQQAIAQAKQTRQSTDPATQMQALTQLDCNAEDPLRGNDDPSLPLVTCGQDKQEKFVLEPVFLEGREIANASAQPPNQQSGQSGWSVNLEFKSGGASTWADFTSANVNQRAAFVLDSQVVSAPNINEPLLGGNANITGQFNQQSATQLADVLKYGSLPLAFDQSEAETVSASLGLASMEAGLIAGGIGLLLVAVYCLFYYRMLGILTILSLILSGAIVYGVLILLGRWIGFTLDLAGIAGFIIAIGITADSFIIFFERLKDEIREGRTFRSSVPRAWVRSRRTILSADAVSFLAAAVLYVLAVGQVKGFAFTLGMSTVLDLIVVFLVTHPLVVLASKNKFLSKPSVTGLGAVQRMGAEQRAARKRSASTAKEA